MKWQVVSVTILIAIGSTICHWSDANDAATDPIGDDLSGESLNEGSEEENVAENGEDESIEILPGSEDEILDPISINENITETPEGQRKSDHLDQGDIMFRKGEEEAEFGINPDGSKISTDRVPKDATVYKHKKWRLPIPYVIESSLGVKARSAIKQAMIEYKTKTCIKFRAKKSTDIDYLSFFKETGCWSYIGRSGGKQQVSLGQGCEYKSVAVHEIMHALGFFHEQSRVDRDKYVKILLHNVEYDERHNFAKQLAKDVTTFGFPYDYQSVMHYKRYDFGRIVKGKRLQTIVRKKDPAKAFGQCVKCGLSDIDADQLNAMYCKAG
ncbi:zinc metalloproteinase nas-4-like [Hydractinia symbiolongicarpus]|uniref:zinc metalloproteinase nas-4-like n=1 Tax=Hydractinia symbiolongicarpus TaxID=13093 RepID=UPI00254DBBD1|nr:zinc metalloproteinase nas-4-like [Hydractinia symbiolongicarpus]